MFLPSSQNEQTMTYFEKIKTKLKPRESYTKINLRYEFMAEPEV